MPRAETIDLPTRSSPNKDGDVSRGWALAVQIARVLSDEDRRELKASLRRRGAAGGGNGDGGEEGERPLPSPCPQVAVRSMHQKPA